MASTALINSKPDLANYKVDDSVFNGVATIGAAAAANAAITLTNADSGRVFIVSKAADADYNITLPALKVGLRFTFIAGATVAHAAIILSNAANIRGTWRQITEAATVAAPATSVAF